MTEKYIHGINKYRHRYFEEKLKDIKINFPEGPYLTKIYEAKVIKMNQLTSSLQFHKSHSTRAIQELARHHYILKEIDPEDQRGYILSITKEGEAVAKLVLKVIYDWESLISSAISDEEKIVIENIQLKIFNKVRNYFNEDSQDDKNL
ncbi:MAG: MarR family transcriptional regulator [Candidatus Izemoplasmatales bacterium]|nr:MarR family transcriptional regulator [Candidatus Izemoplasmatales bacterium]